LPSLSRSCCRVLLVRPLLCSYSYKLFLLYLLLHHVKLLLLHAVVPNPKVDAEAYERRDSIVVYETKLVAVMHYRVYKIPELVFSYFEPDNLCFVKLFWIIRRLFLLIDLSIYRGLFKVSESVSSLIV
jgi:hypothetical protein